ncbi:MULTISPECIES: flavin reductase [Bombella]|uniref:Flavin reductase n=1 Tax=Bombella pollinis TaxID=2967337 RepID=A0ABT3WMR5_9PROT|nr:MULTISPECIES: flavin reductase [Bombella]MCT6836409.1 flavin reductase [Bifidobacteriales bacterium]MCX5619052.1 flavin reductase [Bombella pollinis]MUG05414.1 flavin reductase [Bombella sp. ESL0378]MUG89426.1 flavin reductase [Bombella sp. ESL0385]
MQAIFRNAMSRLGSPVTLVTTDGPAGRYGLTVSAITSVTDTPPTILVCFNRANASHEAFLTNKKLGINILGKGHDDLACAFANNQLTATERFTCGQWHPGPLGSPLLDGALATLDCTIENTHTIGTHDVLICRVHAITIDDGTRHGLTWFDRAFHHLPTRA